MKINSLLETTTSGSVALVNSPVGGMQKRAGSMFKGKKTNKPFYEEKEDYCDACDRVKSECICDKKSVTEGKVKQLAMDLHELSEEQFFEKYKKTKQQMRYSLKGGTMVHDNGQVDVSESRILKGMLEADLREDDLILMPGQGRKFKTELLPKKTDHEVEMARGELYQAAKNAKQICDMLGSISEMQGIDAWVQAKITKAADYLETVRAYMESKHEMQDAIDEATPREKFNRGLKQAGYDPDKRADNLLKLLAKQKREREEFEKKYADVYDTLPKVNVDEDWEDIKAGAGKAWDATKDFFSNIGYSDPAEYGRAFADASRGTKDPEEASKLYRSQLDKRKQWQKDMPQTNMDVEKDRSGYKPYPTDARPVREEELNEIGWSSAADYGSDFAAANKYVPPAEKPAAPAGPSLWDRAKNVVSQMRPYDEKTAASNFGYKQQTAQAKPAQQTPMYEEDDEDLYELSKDTLKSYVPKSVAKAKGIARSNFDKAKKMADTDIPRAMKKLKDPNYGKETVDEESKGLWANIHAKQERIKHGSGERMRKPGSKGAPTKDAFIQSAKKK